MASLIGTQEHFLQLIFIDVCQSALYDDFARTAGMYSDWNQSNHKNVYLGWTTATVANSNGIHAAQFVEHMWNRLGAGDRVLDAWFHCSNHPFGSLQTHFGWQGPDQDWYPLPGELVQTRWTGR
jgi:hypothetical protein